MENLVLCEGYDEFRVWCLIHINCQNSFKIADFYARPLLLIACSNRHKGQVLYFLAEESFIKFEIRDVLINKCY